MSKTIKVNVLDPASIQSAIRELDEYKKWIERKTDELVRRLADIGAFDAHIRFANAYYTGNRDFNVTVEQRGPNSYAIVASGQSILFIEFGSGITYGYGHPQAGEFGFGPGTYPSDKGHWDDPHGWWIPGGQHTYGNPPAMAMYNTAKELRARLTEIAREVFST